MLGVSIMLRMSLDVLTPEKAKYVTEDRVNLNLGLSEKFYKRLKRVQDLESQRLRRPVTLEEAEEAMIDLYLEKKDPIENTYEIWGSAPTRAATNNVGWRFII
jgi:hypothetical protein